MSRRVFVGLPLPADVRADIREKINEWKWLPIQWLPDERWHITLIPPARLNDHEVERLAAAFREARFRARPFIRFTKFTLAPSRRPSRMVWLEGEASGALDDVKKLAEKTWRTSSPSLPDTEGKLFRLHVTLSRFAEGELASIEARSRTIASVNIGTSLGTLALYESLISGRERHYDPLVTKRLGSSH